MAITTSTFLFTFLEVEEYVSLSEYYRFKDYPELETDAWRKSVISPKSRSKSYEPVSWNVCLHNYNPNSASFVICSYHINPV